MDTVLRAAIIYIVLVIVFRLTGRRALAQLTNFDLILLLIISEAVQNGLIGNDYSLTNSILAVVTLIVMDILFAYLKQYLPVVGRLADGMPVIVVTHGRPSRRRMGRCRVDEQDVLEAARKMGLERLDQIKYAVLERTGEISIIPMDSRS